MLPPTRKVVAADNMCCGHKRCPNVEAFDDGTLRIEDNGVAIELTPEQADRLERVLERRRAAKDA